SFYYLLTLVFIDDRYHLHLHSFPTRRSSDLGEEAALAKIIASINKVFRKIPKVKTKIALETTAGQGSCVGHRFEHLAHIIDNVRSEEHTSELQSRVDLVCRLLLEKKKRKSKP